MSEQSLGEDIVLSAKSISAEVVSVTVKAAALATSKGIENILHAVAERLKTTQARKATVQASAKNIVPPPPGLNSFIGECSKNGVGVALVKDPNNADNVTLVLRSNTPGTIEKSLADYAAKRSKSIEAKLKAAMKKSAQTRTKHQSKKLYTVKRKGSI